MRVRTNADAYYQQKHTSKTRGIPFELTRVEWFKWWEDNLGPDWYEKRGRKTGQYVMARIGDVGPYKLGNIKCILCTDNCKEMKRERIQFSAVTKELAAQIYQADGCMAYLSQMHKVGYHTVYDIRNSRSFVALTRRLYRGKDCDCTNGVQCKQGFERLKKTSTVF